MTEPLTQREEQLIVAFQWLADSVHEAHHMITTDRAGNRVKVPDEHRRRRDVCGSPLCSYATKVLAGARQIARTNE